MKTKLVWLVSLLMGCASLCLASEKGEKIKGDGNIVTRSIPVEDFRVLLLGKQINPYRGTGWTKLFSKKNKPAFHYMQTLGAASLLITMDKNLFEELEIEQEKGTLRIGAKDKNAKLYPTCLVISGSSSRLEKVRVSGCMNFVSESLLQTPSLTINIVGVGNVHMDELACDTLSCTLRGVGNFYLTGKAAQASFDLSGVGHMYSFDCQVKDLECHLSGVGSMEVNATEHLHGHVSGVGKLKYKGDAQASTSCSGVGRIKHVED